MKQIQVGQNPIKANFVIQRRDPDLLIIIIFDISVYFITSALFPLVQVEIMISQYVIPNKSSQYLQVEIFTLNISLFILFIHSVAPFYTSLTSSKSFRQDFKQLIMNSYEKLRGQPPVQIISRADKTVANRETRV
jgi:hypothetical protein